MVVIKQSLPDNLASLVNEHCCFIRLRYPDLMLHTVFAVVNKVFSIVDNSDDFYNVWGRSLDSDLTSNAFK